MADKSHADEPKTNIFGRAKADPKRAKLTDAQIHDGLLTNLRAMVAEADADGRRDRPCVMAAREILEAIDHPEAAEAAEKAKVEARENAIAAEKARVEAEQNPNAEPKADEQVRKEAIEANKRNEAKAKGDKD